MTTSGTFTVEATFTVIHARRMACKVATDLKRIQRFYGSPSDAEIAAYEAEVVEFLSGGYLERVTYGFRRNGTFIEPTLRYTAQDLGFGSTTDDDPGRVRPGANIAGARFGSFLVCNSVWNGLSSTVREAVERRLPFTRTTGDEPNAVGFYSQDLTYSAGGRALQRSSLRSI